MAIQHELSWSASRSGTFAECKRRYYYEYYLSWSGWDRRAPKERQQAYLLKKMTRMPMLAGDLVHQAIERWIKERAQGRILAPEDLQRFCAESLREGYRTSRSGAWKTRPSKLIHLAEHHYEEECIQEADGRAGDYGKRYLERMENAVRNFLYSAALGPAREAEPAGFLACEELSTFERFGTKVYAVPDFAYRDAQGTVHVWDWKTGRPSERDVFQLEVYVEFAEASWGADPDQVVCYDAYLGEDHVSSLRTDDESRSRTLERMRVSMAEMAALHFDADRSTGNPADFPQIDPGATCGRCNFRELCDRA
ncbi:MAG: PD-(D/E)XK nuclease family protein [Planctomycetota bacterium]